jgi:hypothetical protein
MLGLLGKVLNDLRRQQRICGLRNDLELSILPMVVADWRDLHHDTSIAMEIEVVTSRQLPCSESVLAQQPMTCPCTWPRIEHGFTRWTRLPAEARIYFLR